MTAPKKYIKVGGVMKLNPEYKKYQEAQSGGTVPATTVARPDAALPVVSSMDDYMQFNEDMGTEVPMAESTSATIEMMQEPEICIAAGSKSKGGTQAHGKKPIGVERIEAINLSILT